MSNRRSLRGAAIAAALTVAIAGVARADDAADKAQLEQRVRDLERELAEVKSSLRGGYFTAGSDLEARVAELERAAGDASMAGAFKAGLRHESADGAFKYQWFGLIQHDSAWYWGDGDRETADALGTELNPGFEFRRVRLGAQGQMYGNVRWWSELEFSGGDVSFADMWIELAGCNFGNVRVGRMKEPMGFDQYTSDRTLQFMERSFVNSMSPGRNVGIMLHGPAMDDQLLYQVGMFREDNAAGDDLANAKDGEYNFTGRLSGRPMIDDDGASWLHLGASARYSDYADDAVVVAAGPAIAQAPAFISTAGLVATDGWQAGAEAAYVRGPWTFLAEYMHQESDIEGAGEADARAWSAEMGYWLTGENTAYDKSKGSFGRHVPRHNFGDGDGMGAWRAAVRFDTIDLRDNVLEAGELDQWTVGLSWILNPNTGVHLNVARVKPDEPTDTLNRVTVVGLRFEIDF